MTIDQQHRPSAVGQGAPDFWLTSGYHLLDRDERGDLVVTDDYFRAFLLRPELRPVAESCEAERLLHRALLEAPRMRVPPSRLAALADPDASENYRAVLELRELLLAHETLEAAYLSQFRGGGVSVAPLFLEQMSHAILRNILDDCADPLRLRAAELLFRRQKVNIAGDSILLADEEVVAAHAAGGSAPPGHLLVDQAAARGTVELDMIGPGNAQLYWERSDRFDMVLDVAFSRPGLDALCRVLEAWVRHFLGSDVRIHPVQTITDERWVWHVGLDSVASGILNDLYNDVEVEDARLEQILSLFRLEFRDPAQMMPEVAGRPIYLAMAMNAHEELQLKPQNLLVNLPLVTAD